MDNSFQPPNDLGATTESFRFVDARQERIHKRLGIIGPGPAEFFYDACRLMVIQPHLKSTTHLVSHLIREIESSVRDVLEPLRSQDEERKKGQEDSHRFEINAILKALAIPETDPIADLWLSLAGKTNERALHARAHRDSLAPARPVDAQFIKFWEDVQAVLDSILDRFEARYLETHRALDEYVVKASPTMEDAKWIKSHVPNTQVAMWGFFHRLKSAAWLEPLHAEGFFKLPYPSAPDEHGNLAHVHWPHSRFLIRMAGTGDERVQEKVLSIFLTIDTENISVHEDRIEAALVMPGVMAAELAEKERAWIETQPHLFGLYPDKLGKLLSHLASQQQTDAAIELLMAVTKISPDPREEDSTEKHRFWHPKPTTKINDWEYRLILTNALSVLVANAPLQTLTLFCNSLETAVRLSRRPGEREGPDDYSDTWREYLGSSSRDGIENILVSAVRKVAEQIVKDDSQLTPDVIRTLELHNWLIFKRLTFHTLKLHPIPELVVELLTNRSNYDQRGLLEEYLELAKDNFHLLSTGQQDEILGWMNEDPDIEVIKKNSEEWLGEVLSEEDARLQIIQRKLRRFTPLKDVLPERWRARYDDWLTKVARPDQAPFSQPSVETTWGLDTPKTREELSQMSVEDVVTFLRGWRRPQDNSDLRQPSPEGLGRELSAVVADRPDQFASIAQSLIGLRPTYVRSLLSGLTTAVNNGAAMSWVPVLSLCGWVLEQPRGETDKSDLLEDHGWGATRQQILRLISGGLEKKQSELEFACRSQVWSLLDVLIEDPDPIHDNETSQGEDVDWISRGINSVRGDALQTVIRYALWTKRYLDNANEKRELRASFEDMPEVRAALERHLDLTNDQSLAIRSIYGRWIPWLCWLDSTWLSENLKRIFPQEPELEQFQRVAWESYIGWTEAYSMVLPILKEEYLRATDRIGTRSPRQGSSRSNPDKRLAEHLMVFYAHGAIELKRDELFRKFFEKASGSLRGHAIWSVGFGLRETKEELPDEVLDRIQVLWRWRLDEGKADPDANREELQQFGWIYVSRKLDDIWSLETLHDTLTVSKGINPDSDVVEVLAQVASRNLKTAVECLRLIVESTTEDWKIRYWERHIRAMLSGALQGDDSEIATIAEDLVNRLAARGETQFEDLLPARAVKYVAYGSNMLTRRLRQRVPSARFSAVTKLTKHRLKFHKVSIDKKGNRSAKCNVYSTGREEDVVYGVAFNIDRKEKWKLDEAEDGYGTEVLTLTSQSGAVPGFMYCVVDNNLLDDSLRPYGWYKDLVVAGAREHNLPEEYIQQLESVESVKDPDKDRDLRNRRLLR